MPHLDTTDTMFGFLANRFQNPRAGEQTTRPGWFDRHFTPVLLSIAKKACTHPVHTIVTIAFLASYSYLGVLDKGFLEQSDATPGQVDLATLLAGSKRLRVGQETAWKWETQEHQPASVEQVCRKITRRRPLLTECHRLRKQPW